MVKRTCVFLTLVILLAGCSKEDMHGRKLTDTESRALETCNIWLGGQMRDTLGSIKSSEALFDTKNAGQVDIAWMAQTKVGKGMAVCSTDESGSFVKFASIDGVAINPN